MASKQDILTAIKNLDVFLKIPALNGATARLNKNGSPFVFTGGFNMVFQLTHNTKKWAFRVWHVPIGENKERYLKISKYLSFKKLPYFADFIYDEKGLLVNGELVDTIRMEWLDGLLFKDYIEKYLNNKSELEKLANNFVEMTKSLRENKISHGDLQDGNILVTNNGNIKLVDYDSICIPEIEGQEEFVTGLKGYQHPSRFTNSKCSTKADYFSELVIYLSVLALSENPELWAKYKVIDTEVLLFNQEDFQNFNQSEIKKDLLNLSPAIKILVNILEEYLKEKDFNNLLPFDFYLQPPEILFFESDQPIAISGVPIKLRWRIEKAHSISIDNNIGDVTGLSEVKIFPQSNTKYTITAKGYYDTAKAETQVKIFPTPVIETLFIPTPDFNKGVSITPISISSPHIQNKVEFENSLFVTTPQFIELNQSIASAKPLLKKEKVTISAIFERIKQQILNNI